MPWKVIKITWYMLNILLQPNAYFYVKLLHKITSSFLLGEQTSSWMFFVLTCRSGTLVYTVPIPTPKIYTGKYSRNRASMDKTDGNVCLKLFSSSQNRYKIITEDHKNRYMILEKWIAEAWPVNCTDPEKLPAALVAVGAAFAAVIFLQTPKRSPACKKKVHLSISSKVNLCSHVCLQ